MSETQKQQSQQKQVCHVFLWKWNQDEYSDDQKKIELLRELEELFDEKLLWKLTCGDNCINDLDLQGAGENPKSSFSADFDCGLHAIAKSEECFRRWWSSDQHAAFMNRHPNFSTTKINLQWRS